MASGPTSGKPRHRFAAPLLRPVGAANAPPAGRREPAPDPLVEGFERLDGADRPVRISEAAWSYVFPPDRMRIRRLAGRFFLFGEEPDDAVHLAIEEFERERCKVEPMASRLAALKPGFPDGGHDMERRMPTEPALAAAKAVWTTAWRHGREILADADPERAAFRYREWHAPAGCCLICGKPASADDAVFQGDAIHADCTPRMATIGPAFGKLVVAEARRIEAGRPPAAEPDPDLTLDPDDPSIWWSLVE